MARAARTNRDKTDEMTANPLEIRAKDSLEIFTE